MDLDSALSVFPFLPPPVELRLKAGQLQFVSDLVYLNPGWALLFAPENRTKLRLKTGSHRALFVKRQGLALGGFSLCPRQVRHCAPRASGLGRSWVKKKPLTARWMIDARVFAALAAASFTGFSRVTSVVPIGKNSLTGRGRRSGI